MKYPIRLYDVSLGNAVLIIAANLVLICLCAGTAAVSGNPLPWLIVLLLLIVALVAQAWYFLWRSPILDEHSISQGKRRMDKTHVTCEPFYDARFREKTLRFYDKKANAKEIKACITVQATKRNIKQAAAWLGLDPSELAQVPMGK